MSQFQQLLREERTVRRQVRCGGKITQKKSALAPVEALQRCRSRLSRETALRDVSPTSPCDGEAALRPRCHRRCSRGGDRRTTLNCGVVGPHHPAGEPSPAENLLHTVANQAVRNSMATQTQTHTIVSKMVTDGSR